MTKSGVEKVPRIKKRICKLILKRSKSKKKKGIKEDISVWRLPTDTELY